MPATVRYNTLRLLMVLVVGAVCYLLGARGALLVLLALLISMPLSFVLLARWRRAMIDEFAEGRAGKANPARAVRALNNRIESSKSAEDAAVDARMAEPDDPAEQRAGEQDGPPEKV